MGGGGAKASNGRLGFAAAVFGGRGHRRGPGGGFGYAFRHHRGRFLRPSQIAQQPDQVLAITGLVGIQGHGPAQGRHGPGVIAQRHADMGLQVVRPRQLVHRGQGGVAAAARLAHAVLAQVDLAGQQGQAGRARVRAPGRLDGGAGGRQLPLDQQLLRRRERLAVCGFSVAGDPRGVARRQPK